MKYFKGSDDCKVTVQVCGPVTLLIVTVLPLIVPQPLGLNVAPVVV